MINKTTVDWIIHGLKCGISGAAMKCALEKCPYHFVEDLTGKRVEALADFEENGRKFCHSCDVDAIAIDAIKILEKVKELMK